MTHDSASVAGEPHVELESVAAVGEGVIKGGNCIFSREDLLNARQPAAADAHRDGQAGADVSWNSPQGHRDTEFSIFFILDDLV